MTTPNPLRAIACTCDPMVCLKFKLGPMMLAERGCPHRDARLALEITRREAFEEAAKLCDEQAAEDRKSGAEVSLCTMAVLTCRDLAERIRALASEPVSELAVPESQNGEKA